MSGGQLFLAVLAGLSCLISGAAFMFLQSIGWKSDGPGALCPMIIWAGFGLVGFAAWKELLFGDKGGKPER